MKKTYQKPQTDQIVISEEQHLMVESEFSISPYKDITDPNNNLGKDDELDYFGW